MTITFPLSHPTAPGIAAVTWGGDSVVGITQSPFSKKQEVFRWGGQAWVGSVTLPPMERAAAEAWTTFLAKCDGMWGTFLIGDPNGATPRGSGLGTPLVDGASQTGLTLNTKGWTPNETGVLLEGDYLSLGTGTATRLHKVLGDVNADGSGLATLDIWPRLRESPADSDVITITSAKGTFRLSSNQFNWSEVPGVFYSLQFGIMEAL